MADENPYRYAGYQYDQETGLYYLIARYYHPTHGVFLSMDPDPGDSDDILTQNGYTYANNNPVMLVDPDGHFVWMAINAGFAAYDGYKAYKSGKGWMYVAKKTALGAVGGRKLKLVRGAGKYIVKVGRQYTKSNFQLGRQMHKKYMAHLHDELKGRIKEYKGIKGIRPDFVDFNTRTIYELKPYNPRAIARGKRQLKKYKRMFEQERGGKWKTILHVY
ncbi:RHS repeat-associated core domain-containing protein, partial [Anoxybacteroides rupiense]